MRSRGRMPRRPANGWCWRTSRSWRVPGGACAARLPSKAPTCSSAPTRSTTTKRPATSRRAATSTSRSSRRTRRSGPTAWSTTWRRSGASSITFGVRRTRAHRPAAGRPAHHQPLLLRGRVGRARGRRLHPLQRLHHQLQDAAPVVAAARAPLRDRAGRPRHRLPVDVPGAAVPAVLYAVFLQIAREDAAQERLPDAEHRQQLAARQDDRGVLLLGHQPQLRHHLPHSGFHRAGPRAHGGFPRQAARGLGLRRDVLRRAGPRAGTEERRHAYKDGGVSLYLGGKSDLGRGFTARGQLNYLSSLRFRQEFTDSFNGGRLLRGALGGVRQPQLVVVRLQRGLQPPGGVPAAGTGNRGSGHGRNGRCWRTR